ncbi:MAG: calcium-binding protein, partial [Sulfurimonas sp.]|nr:calcium-binding protein [Sulfurimonas sp.]
MGGDSSDETVWGHEGNDNLRGWNGADTLYGGTGDDFLLPGRHLDHSDGGDGVDFLHLYYDALKNKTQQWLRLDESGTVQYSTNVAHDNWTDGYDTSDGVNTAVNVEGIYGSSGADHIIGNSKDNRFEGHNGDDEIFGEGGDDFIRGGNGADALEGGDGDDIIYGDGDNDTIDAGAGDDTIYGHSVYNKNYTNNDTIDGGIGNDTLNYNSSGYGFVLDMNSIVGGYATVDFSASLPTTHSQNNTGNNDAFDDKIKNIENIHGSRGGDDITGDANVNIINGWWGADTIDGGGGNDILYGGVHVDNISGGDGDDYINLDQYSDTDTRVHGQNGEYAYGGAGNDTIVSQGGSDYLYGDATDAVNALNRVDAVGDGDDTFIVNYRPYELHAGGGRDVLTLGDTYLYLRNADIKGLEELNVGSGRTYFNRDQFFNDNAFDKLTGDDNSQLFMYGSNNVNDNFDFSSVDLSGFSGMFNFYAYSGVDSLKIGSNQDINMNEYYYNTFELIEIGANSNLNIEAYSDSGRTYYLHRDFSNVDVSS